MNNIKRYDVAPGGSAEDMTPAVDGSWVRFEDAQAEIARLQTELQAKDERRERLTMAHTPGPWTQFGDEIYAADGTRIAEAVTMRDVLLLTTAPELLQALRDLVDVMTDRKEGETAALHNALIVLTRIDPTAG